MKSERRRLNLSLNNPKSQTQFLINMENGNTPAPHTNYTEMNDSIIPLIKAKSLAKNDMGIESKDKFIFFPNHYGREVKIKIEDEVQKLQRSLLKAQRITENLANLEQSQQKIQQRKEQSIQQKIDQSLNNKRLYYKTRLASLNKKQINLREYHEKMKDIIKEEEKKQYDKLKEFDQSTLLYLEKQEFNQTKLNRKNSPNATTTSDELVQKRLKEKSNYNLTITIIKMIDQYISHNIFIEEEQLRDHQSRHNKSIANIKERCCYNEEKNNHEKMMEELIKQHKEDKSLKQQQVKENLYENYNKQAQRDKEYMKKYVKRNQQFTLFKEKHQLKQHETKEYRKSHSPQNNIPTTDQRISYVRHQNSVLRERKVNLNQRAQAYSIQFFQQLKDEFILNLHQDYRKSNDIMREARIQLNDLRNHAQFIQKSTSPIN